MKVIQMYITSSISLFIIAATLVGCQSSSPTRVENSNMGRLTDTKWQKKIISDHYDRTRLREDVGNPTLDDGEEWIYLAKFEENGGIGVNMLFAIYASLDNPVWKMIVVTFNSSGTVERVRVATVDSSIAERTPRQIIFGIYSNRANRVRMAVSK